MGQGWGWGVVEGKGSHGRLGEGRVGGGEGAGL